MNKEGEEEEEERGETRKEEEEQQQQQISLFCVVQGRTKKRRRKKKGKSFETEEKLFRSDDKIQFSRVTFLYKVPVSERSTVGLLPLGTDVPL